MTVLGLTRRVLVIGGGIGGLTAALALCRKGFAVDLIERDPEWSVYGVGIIQQSNVIRAMSQLGLLDEYLAAGFGFDQVEIFIPSGERVARVQSPRLVPGRPANLGIARPALQAVLADRARRSGTRIRLGVTARSFDDRGADLEVIFSDGSVGRYWAAVAADGAYSSTRRALFPEEAEPEFTGQGVWRYNFPRPDDVRSLQVFNGPVGVGLVPMSDAEMYMFVTSPEPAGQRYPVTGLAAAMRAKLSAVPAPQIRALAASIDDDRAVVFRPLEKLFVEGPWHDGRVVLLGDAIHATTPHLGQGAGMAIEDSLVLAEVLADADTPEQGFRAYRDRRYERCRYIVEASLAIGEAQLGRGPPVDQQAATQAMFEMTARPI